MKSWHSGGSVLGGMFALLAVSTALAQAPANPLPVTTVTPSSGPEVVRVNGEADGDVAFWLTTSLQRVFPRTAPGSTRLELLAARNSRIAFQVAFRNNRTQRIDLECKIRDADDLKPQIRYVGMVPVHHFTPGTDLKELDGVDAIPGLVPDPLWPMTRIFSGPNESRSFWITLNIPADAKPGQRVLTAEMTLLNGKKSQVRLPVTLEVSRVVAQPRRDFHVTHWWRGEATWDVYKTGMFEDEKWWRITRAQMRDMLEHGSDVVYVPIFFDRRETFKRPCQLLIVNEPTPGHYDFDWSRVKRFTDMCKEVGFKKWEWSHLWIYWGVENAMRIYTRKGPNYVMLWPPETAAMSPTFVNFLKQFLPQFHTFLTQEGLLDDSYFHLSDEPGSGQHVENYKRARALLRELAPWMKVMDALSDIRYGREGLTDIPVPLVASAQAYIDAKIPHWVYYCCAPHGEWLNRFLDTPLAKVRMSGWLFYRLGAKGFLHWGYNYWHRIEQEVPIDPFNETAASAWPDIQYGDPFVIYPGADGPMDSIRWEVFAESLQDYALLQTLRIKPDDPLLKELHSYKDFPKNEEWLRKARERLLRGGA